MSLRLVLAENLRALRKECGLTQGELAALTGISSTYVGQIERAEAYPSEDVLEQLARALKAPPGELLFDDDLMLYRFKKLLSANKKP